MYFFNKISLWRNFIEKYINLIYNRLFCCNHTCNSVGMVYVTSASRYVTSAHRCPSRSSMYIRGLIRRNSTAFAEAVPINSKQSLYFLHIESVDVNEGSGKYLEL